MSRILLLLENKKNQDLLASWLAMRYQVISNARHALDSMFDLCIIDGPTLDRIWEKVQVRKAREFPLFLPFVLVTPLRNVDMVTRYLWKTVDELLRLPIEKVELQARVEVLLRTRQLSLKLKHRTEDLESFFYAMTHDLRAPLRAIKGFLEALVEDEECRLGKQERHFLERMQSATGQMQELIDALVEFASMEREELPMQGILLQTVVENCIRQLQEDIRAKEARVLITNELPAVYANPVLLKIALMNLLTNAFKFVSPGVRPEVTISAHVVEGVCHLQIRDNGIGIDPQKLPRLFTPFVQLHGVEVYPGIGLGLATVRKAIERMGGRVGVISTPGKGSVFWIELSTAGEVKHALSHY